MISMKKYIHILTTLFFLTFVSAQELKLEGEILDSSNKSPLAFANIILEGTSLGAASDNEGRFIIEKIQAGTYTVIASYMGYSVYKKEIIIPYELDSGKLSILTTLSRKIGPTHVIIEFILMKLASRLSYLLESVLLTASFQPASFFSL